MTTIEIPDRLVNRLKRFLYGDCETLKEAILDGIQRGQIAGERLRRQNPSTTGKIRVLTDVPAELQKVGAERRRTVPKV